MSVGMCECDWRNCHHKGRAVSAHDHGNVSSSPELCMACLFCCEGERDDEIDALAARGGRAEGDPT